MGFEACHPAVNFIFFAAAIYGAVSFKHPVFLAIAYVCAFAYSVKRCGKRAIAFNLFLLPLILILPRLFGVNGLIAVQPCSDVLSTLLGVWILRPNLRRLKALEENHQGIK